MEYVVKRITGRFKNLGNEELEDMRLRMKRVLKFWGAVCPDEDDPLIDEGLPLWAEVEFLDNVIQFEMECNPFLASEVMN